MSREILEKWAGRLDGRQYGSEMTPDEEKESSVDGVVIAFGYSDDNIELRGKINDEFPSWVGSANREKAFKITPDLNIYYEKEAGDTYELSDNIYNKDQVKDFFEFTAIWRPDFLDCSWFINAPDKVDSRSFDILEDGEIYCRGVVVMASEIERRGKTREWYLLRELSAFIQKLYASSELDHIDKPENFEDLLCEALRLTGQFEEVKK